jgi:hypothetical protein
MTKTLVIINTIQQLVAPSTLFKFSITEANSLFKFDVYGSPLKLSLTLSGHSFSLFEQDQKLECPSYKMQTFLKGHETKLLTQQGFQKVAWTYKLLMI